MGKEHGEPHVVGEAAQRHTIEINGKVKKNERIKERK
jgi:hypothetical protein